MVKTTTGSALLSYRQIPCLFCVLEGGYYVADSGNEHAVPADGVSSRLVHSLRSLPLSLRTYTEAFHHIAFPPLLISLGVLIVLIPLLIRKGSLRATGTALVIAFPVAGMLRPAPIPRPTSPYCRFGAVAVPGHRCRVIKGVEGHRDRGALASLGHTGLHPFRTTLRPSATGLAYSVS